MGLARALPEGDAVQRLGHIAEIFLCVLALLMVLVLVRDGARRRNSRRRR